MTGTGADPAPGRGGSLPPRRSVSDPSRLRRWAAGQERSRGTRRGAEAPPPPRDIVANPRLSRWITVATDGTVGLRVGKVELGQGILTALAQVAADELGVPLAQVLPLPAHTTLGPDEGLTAGSMSVSDAAPAVRLAAANARARFVAAAARRWGVEPADVTVEEGVVRGPGADTRTSYAELAGEVDLDVDIDPEIPVIHPDRARLVGSSAARLDLPDTVAGRPRFIADLRLPGMRFGRVVRPPSPGAKLRKVDGLPPDAGDLRVVRDGSFLGVVGADETAVARAAEALRAACHWDEQDGLPDEADLAGFLRAGPHEQIPVLAEEPDAASGKDADGRLGEDADGRLGEDRAGGSDAGPGDAGPGDAGPGDAGTSEPGTGDAAGGEPAAAAPARRVRARYSRPFLAHASIGVCCGAARWEPDGRLSVWSHSQGIHRLRDAIAAALGIDAGRVTVEHVPNAGSYGHNGADDAAFDAVLLARAVPGVPVLVQWTRQDELAWSPVGSATVAEAEAMVTGSGRIAGWTYDVYSQGHTARPGYAGVPGLLAGAYLERPLAAPAPVDPPAAAGAGSMRNAVPIYTVGPRRITGHRLLETPIRSSSLRSLGAFLNVFSIESFMEELAEACGADPLAFRLRHLPDERARAVLETAADAAGWGAAPLPDHGQGIGLARYKDRGAYCAVVADVEASDRIRVHRLTVAVDVGRVINPDGVRNQIEGGATQATSWTTKEQVRFDRRRITSVDWESYPILRFSEAPEVDVHLLDRPDLPSVGAGEAAQGPTAAAIGNAVAAALGVRVRDLPITTETVVTAIESQAD